MRYLLRLALRETQLMAQCALFAVFAAGVARANVTPGIYWVTNHWTIGHANLDGTGVDPNFIHIYNHGNLPGALAVDHQHLYWTDLAPDKPGSYDVVARANLDGSCVNRDFVLIGRPPVSGVVPQGMAVDTQHIYWSEPQNGGVGRANLDGSGVNRRFISGPGADIYEPGWGSVTVDQSHIYWIDIQGGNGYGGGIDRANLGGTGAQRDFVDGPNDNGPDYAQSPVAVDSQYIFADGIDSSNNEAIMRANIDGTGLNEDLIVVNTDTIDNPDRFVHGIAVTGQYLYWSQNGTTIERANLDGTGVISHFINAGPDGIDGPIAVLASPGQSAACGHVRPAARACVVPKLVGKTLAAAKAAIASAGCRLGRVTRRNASRSKRGWVTSQSPSPGKRVARGTRVKLVIGK